MWNRRKTTTKLWGILLALCLLTGLLSAGGFSLSADAADAAHGTCTVSGTTATVKPDQNYDLCTLSYVSGLKTVYVDCSKWVKSGNSYTISVPASAKATIKATFFCTSVWDGSLDVSWYSSGKTTFHLTNPAQLAGLAAIVNGIYNDDIDRAHIKGDISCIVDNTASASSGGAYGLNKSTSTYHYGADDFNGKTVYLDCDMDMGGVLSGGTWTGEHNYMPIGGQYLMNVNSSLTKLGSSFNGTLDGQGYTVKNIYCNRYNPGENYGDGASVGLIGRMGVHDNDPVSLRAYQPTVRNIVVTGYIYARRSVGGIVGKIGKTQVNNASRVGYGALIENCANYCTVISTDAKGAAGICGSAWNGGIIRNCYNAGTIRSSYGGPCGGIAGYNEISIENCYNIGLVTNTAADRYAEAIGSHNGGSYIISNCYWLEGTAANGGYYKVPDGCEGEVTECTSASMKSADFLTKLNAGGNAFVADSAGTNKGYPVLRCTLHKSAASVTGFSYDISSVPADYIVGATPDLSKLKIWANLSDGTREQVRSFQVKCQGTEYTVDGTYCSKQPVLTGSGNAELAISGTYGGKSFSTTLSITIDSNVTPLSLSVSGFDTHTYAAGESPVVNDAVVTVSYKSNTTGKYGSRQVMDYTVTADAQNSNGTLKYGAKKLVFSFTLGGKTVTAEEKLQVVASAPKVADNVCTISSAEDLLWFASQVNERGNYTLDAVLTKDISFASTALTPIGASSKDAYAGTFDGCGHTVTLGAFQSASLGSISDGLALFGYTKNAEIKNLTVAGKVSGTAQIAGIISQDTGYTKVTSCENKASIAASSGCAGGITAMISGPDSVYSSCRNSGAVSDAGSKGTVYGTGGIVGHISSGCTVSDCSNTGNVSAAASPVGGIIGEISSAQVMVTGCENSGKVQNQASPSDFADTGGILGTVAGDQTATVSACENTGVVSSSATSVGGIAGGSGISSRMNLTLCSNSGTVKGADAVGGIAGNVAYSIVSCCNTGAVTATAANASASYTGTGGMIGCSKAALALKNCYSTGKVNASANAGALIGCAFNYVTAENDYYLSGTAASAANSQDSRFISGLSSCEKQAADMKSAAFLTLLGNGFLSDSGNVNGGYPVINKNAAVSIAEENFSVPSGQKVSTLKVSKKSSRVTYASGEAFDASGLEVTLTLSSGEAHVIKGSLCTITPSKLTKDTKWVTISYGGQTATQDVTVLSCSPLVESNGTYTVSSSDQYTLFAALVNEAGKTGAAMNLTADITASVSLGSEKSPYTGTITGNNHKITLATTTGLVAFGNGASVSGITAAGKVSGTTNVGAILGEGTNVTITNCKNTAVVTGTGSVGGIAGSMSGGSVTGCSNTAAMKETGRSNVGGIVGTAAEGCAITDCSNSGAITAGTSSGGIVGSGDAVISSCTNSGALNCSGYSNVGGIIGSGSGSISKSTNSGKITAGNNAGGLAGSYEGSVSGSTNSGTVTGSTYVGGIAGAFKGTAISTSYNLSDVTGETQVGGIAGTLTLGNVSSCGAGGTLTATTKATTSGNGLGGMIGYLDSGEPCALTDCSFAGALAAENTKVIAGTMVGYAATSLSMSGCRYADGSASADVGFILGTATKTGSAEKKESLFLDVPDSAWYADAVSYAYTNNLFSGYGNGKFGPEDTMTRAMFVTVLNSYCGKPVPKSLNAFTDVASSAWYAKNVNWAYENGIVAGTGPSVFSPNKNITLESMVVVLYNYCGGTPGETVPTEYGDVSSWAGNAMSWASQQGLFDGIGGTLSAKGAATRAQVAAMMMNLSKMEK